MARKKDFSQVDTQDIYAQAIEQSTAKPAPEKPKAKGKRKPRKVYDKEQAAEFLEERRTAGRKGVKLPRVNVAFSPAVYDYVKTMARATGTTYTDFINAVLKQHMDEHGDTYKKAVEFRNSLK